MKRLRLYLRGVWSFWRCYRMARTKSHGAGRQPVDIALWLASCDRFIIYGQHYPGSRSWKKHALRLWEGQMAYQRSLYEAGLTKEEKDAAKMAVEASMLAKLP